MLRVHQLAGNPARRLRLPMLGVLLAASVAVPNGPASASANETTPGYGFTPIAFLGDPAPGGGFFTFDFEPSAVNSRGQVAFTADLADTAGGSDVGEGVFVGRPGHVSKLARVGDPAPGDGTFAAAELGRIGLSNGGDSSFGFTLTPFDPSAPIGLNAGVYALSRRANSLSSLLMPGQPAPGGGTFMGTYFNTAINNRSDVVFSGIVKPESSQSMWTGLFMSGGRGDVVSVVRLGDRAPGGGVFDSAINGSINDAGDIAFGGHVAGEECVNLGSPLVCGESVYLRSSGDRMGLRPGEDSTIQSIAHQGTPSPCAGTKYRTAFGPLVNNRGDIAFVGDLTPPPDNNKVTGVFLFSEGNTTRVACPGDPMPGGGRMVSAGGQDGTYSMNDDRQVSFAAAVSTAGGTGSGIYVFSDGAKNVVARTGTVIPGVGTIANVGLGAPGTVAGQAGGEINDRGQVLLSATLTDTRVVLLLATPKGDRSSVR